MKPPEHTTTTHDRPEQVPMTDAHPMQPIVVAEDGRIRFKKNQIVDDLYELHKVHKLDLNEMACRNYSQEDRNQFAQLIGYSVGGWGTLSYAIDVEKADAIADGIIAPAKKEGPSLNWWRLLPVGTMQCPKDSEPLHWEVFGGMRVRHQKNRGHVYHARCPKCRKEFEVLAPKEKL